MIAVMVAAVTEVLCLSYLVFPKMVKFRFLYQWTMKSHESIHCKEGANFKGTEAKLC